MHIARLLTFKLVYECTAKQLPHACNVIIHYSEISTARAFDAMVSY